MNLIDELNDFLNKTKDAREIKRAIAVKMRLLGKSSREIEELLEVSQSFISNWKNRVIVGGIECLSMNYKGSKGYLRPEQKEKIINWLQEKETVKLSELQKYLREEYNIVFESNQSYYSLFKEANISWKKTQKYNPRKDEQLVEAKKKEIKEKLSDWQVEIENETLTVFMIDECHLLWGDMIGYAWGKTNMRIKVPIKNEKERQTYYGALDYKTKEFIIKAYPAGNTENTINFIRYLQEIRPGNKLALFWDGATYHCSEQFREFLSTLNDDLEGENRLINCIKFAPNGPEQNPVEDIWLQAKNFIRRYYHLCDSFKVVKWLFEFFTNGQIFDFPKIYEYDFLPQPI
jgi:putative transposase